MPIPDYENDATVAQHMASFLAMLLAHENPALAKRMLATIEGVRHHPQAAQRPSAHRVALEAVEKALQVGLNLAAPAPADAESRSRSGLPDWDSLFGNKGKSSGE